MPTQTYSDVVARIASGTISLRAAARLLGMSEATLRRRLSTHPDIVRARAEGKIRNPVDMTPVNVEDLKTNPAVLAVVNEGLSLRAAVAKFPDNGTTDATTLGRWVNKAFPEYDTTRGHTGRRSTAEVAAPFLDVLLGYARQTAAELDMPIEKVLKLAAKRLEETS